MEGFNLFRVISRQWITVVIVTLVVFAISFMYSRGQKESFFGSMAVTVHVSTVYPQQNLIFLQSDQQQQTLAAVATSQSWLQDPSYVKTILDGAQVQLTSPTLKSYSDVFIPVSSVANASTYEVEYIGATQDEVNRVYTSMQSQLKVLEDQYNQAATDNTKVSLSFSDPIVVNQGSNIPLLPLEGLVSGFVFALILAALFEGSRSAKQ